MKLKTNINKHKLGFKKKFDKVDVNNLKAGDYLRLNFLAHNQKKRGGENLRINKQTVILLKKKHRKFSLSLLVTSLYKHEKVKIRYIISSPHFIKIKFLKKALKFKND